MTHSPTWHKHTNFLAWACNVLSAPEGGSAQEGSPPMVVSCSNTSLQPADDV